MSDTPTQQTDDSDLGLHGKYEVSEGGEPVEDCFVLEPETDPRARAALAAYAEVTGNDSLRADLREWLDTIDPEPDEKLSCPVCRTEFARMEWLRMEEFEGEETAVNHWHCLECHALVFEQAAMKASNWISRERLNELRGRER